jgi:hypothetical protein
MTGNGVPSGSVSKGATATVVVGGSVVVEVVEVVEVVDVVVTTVVGAAAVVASDVVTAALVGGGSLVAAAAPTVAVVATSSIVVVGAEVGDPTASLLSLSCGRTTNQARAASATTPPPITKGRLSDLRSRSLSSYSYTAASVREHHRA